jgi:putative intracellular protease/amidase
LSAPLRLGLALAPVKENEMPDKRVFILVFDGFAYWEPSYALAELRRWGKYAVTAVGYSTDPVISMGGLRILPDCAIGDVRAEEVAIFILPGGDAWEGNYPAAALEPLLDELATRRIPIAAICGATLAVARAGLLHGRQHTSNARDYLEKMLSGYADADHYVEAPAVQDRGVITASGLSAVEFACEIFAALQVFNESDLRLWFNLFKHGDASGTLLVETNKP